MASLQPSFGFKVDRAKENIVYREVSRANRPVKKFGRPPENVVKNCRARTGRPIANVPEVVRQRAKLSQGKRLKGRLWYFKFSVSRLKQSHALLKNCQGAKVSRLLICRHRNFGCTLVPQIGHNG